MGLKEEEEDPYSCVKLEIEVCTSVVAVGAPGRPHSRRLYTATAYPPTWSLYVIDADGTSVQTCKYLIVSRLEMVFP